MFDTEHIIRRNINQINAVNFISKKKKFNKCIASQLEIHKLQIQQHTESEVDSCFGIISVVIWNTLFR